MAEKDIMEKTLESHEDVFADIVNVLLFSGKKIIRVLELLGPVNVADKTHQIEIILGKHY